MTSRPPITAPALVSVAWGWVGLRRLQRGESADWLLRNDREELIALEVSGLDGPPDRGRLAEKMRQVNRVNFTDAKSACVVAFHRFGTVFGDAVMVELLGVDGESRFPLQLNLDMSPIDLSSQEGPGCVAMSSERQRGAVLECVGHPLG